jgi:hypothetical protein
LTSNATHSESAARKAALDAEERAITLDALRLFHDVIARELPRMRAGSAKELQAIRVLKIARDAFAKIAGGPVHLDLPPGIEG